MLYILLRFLKTITFKEVLLILEIKNKLGSSNPTDKQEKFLHELTMIKDIWDNDSKFCCPNGIKRCWRKTDIITSTMNADLNMK